MRKYQADDFALWRMRQENISKPFPYVFPQMPPRFRRGRRFIQTLFLIERVSACVLIFVGLMGALFLFFQETERLSLIAGMAMILFLFIWLFCRLLRRTPKFFWHCPCCGFPFPYYAPHPRSSDDLKMADNLYLMERQHIEYVKTKFCPLAIPSVCPKCRRKFFDMPRASSSKAI